MAVAILCQFVQDLQSFDLISTLHHIFVVLFITNNLSLKKHQWSKLCLDAGFNAYVDAYYTIYYFIRFLCDNEQCRSSVHELLQHPFICPPLPSQVRTAQFDDYEGKKFEIE